MLSVVTAVAAILRIALACVVASHSRDALMRRGLAPYAAAQVTTFMLPSYAETGTGAVGLAYASLRYNC